LRNFREDLTPPPLPSQVGSRREKLSGLQSFPPVTLTPGLRNRTILCYHELPSPLPNSACKRRPKEAYST
ncbi:MAG: hypothetical protein ACKN9U_05720, partial [Pirellulaceae bacterium]